MPNVRNIVPSKKSETGAGRALKPFTHSMEEFFENSFPRRWMEGFFEPYAWKRPQWGEFGETLDVMPKIDILDRDDALVVRAELPGVKKDDLEITIAGDRLTFEAKRDFKEEEKKEDFFRSEMGYGRMYRSVHLPVDVMGDKTKAELKDGVLEIMLPKVEATTPCKIKVA